MLGRRSGLFHWRLFFVILVGILVLVTPVSVFAHGESISVSPAKAMPGDTVTIAGKDFDQTGVTIPITLESAHGTVSLGTVDVPDSGEFTTTVKIPADIASGTYTLAVTTSDGQVTADFAVEGSSSAAPTSNQAMGTELIPQRSMPETIAIGIIIAALIAAGSFLILASTEKRRKPAKECEPAVNSAPSLQYGGPFSEPEEG